MTQPTAGRRRLALLAAHRKADRAGQPWLASTTRGLTMAILLGLVHDMLPPFAYGVFAISALMGMVALALVGDWSHLLRASDEEDWLASLPATDMDRRIARTMHVALLVLHLSLPSALIAAWLAPNVGLIERVAFAGSMLGSAVATAAILALLVQLFTGRLDGLWISLQAAGIGVFVWGLVEALGQLDRIALLPELGDSTAPFMWLVPPAWFASPLSSLAPTAWRLAFPIAPTILGCGLLALTPAPRAVGGLARSWLDFALRPVRALACKVWVRTSERASFDLIYDALPREREVVLRSYPLVALPLVFLVLAISGSDDAARADFLAVILFGAALYLPVLMTQAPVSRSWQAAWLLETSPTAQADIQLGALKALVVRFVVPLYTLFALLTASLEGPLAIVRLTVPAFTVAVLAVVRLWPACVQATPLSIAPDEFVPPTAWYTTLIGWAMGFALLGIAVERVVSLPFRTLAFVVVAIALEQLSEWQLRRSLGGQAPSSDSPTTSNG